MFLIGSRLRNSKIEKKYRDQGFPGFKAQSRERKNYQNPVISGDPEIPGSNITFVIFHKGLNCRKSSGKAVELQTITGEDRFKTFFGAEGTFLENFAKFTWTFSEKVIF